METLEKPQQIGVGQYYFLNNENDKHYFGGFLNLAQNNILHIFTEFCLRLHIDYKNNDPIEIVNNYFTDTISFSDWERAIRILQEYLPVIDYLDLPVTHPSFDDVPMEQKETVKRKYFVNTFRSLLKAIDALRNFYTHAYHSPISISDDVYTFLDSILLSVTKKVKKDRMKDDNTRMLLKKRISEEFEVLRQLKKEELIEKRKTNRKVKINDPKGIENAIFNDAFGQFMYKKGADFELADRMKSEYIVVDYEAFYSPITQYGFVFLLSMFLSRKETEQLKANLKGFKGKSLGAEEVVTKQKNSLSFMATHWIFSYLAFKGVKQRVKNTFDKETLLLQMVDELSKVPNEIYRNLSEHDKEEFLEDMNEYIQETKGENKSLQESVVVHPVIRKRYENKFLYFAMRFLDEFANFPTLKFQIFAGHYLHDKRFKPIGTSNLASNRMIKERINLFGKLSEICKYKSDYFAGSSTELGWELFPNPSYNVVGRNIPVHIDLLAHGEEAKAVWRDILQIRKKANPEKKRKIREEKQGIIQKIYSDEKNLKTGDPTALLSANEIPALLYEFLVNKKTGEQLEQILVKNIVERYHIISNYDAQQNFTHSQMSKKLLKSSNKDQYNLIKLKQAIQREIVITDEKLTLIKQNREYTDIKYEKTDKGRKYVFYTKEIGQEATWLANDLKRWMPEKARAQWKGQHHSELQRFLAFYDRHKNDAKSLLFENWDFNTTPEWGKDFAEAFNSNNSFDQFYEAYLNIRTKLLHEFIGLVSAGNSNTKFLKKVFIVFKKRLYTLKNTTTQKRELLAKPLVFPRGIFDDKPTFIKGKKIDTSPELFADWYRYCYDNENSLQSFYNLQLVYIENYTKTKENSIEFKNNDKRLAYKEQLELFKKKEDYAIKRIKHQDLFAKLMVDHMFEQVFKQKLNVPLMDFYQTKAQRQENFRIALRQKDRAVGDASDNLLNCNFLWNKTIELCLYNGQVIEPQVKLKEIGKFRKLEHDSRIQQILQYDTTRIWNKLQLEDELENKRESYERIRREKMLKLFHELENYILKINDFDGVNHPQNLEYNNYPNFKMYMLNLIEHYDNHQEYDGINVLQSEFMNINIANIREAHLIVQKIYIIIALRNKFAHNQLPNMQVFGLIKSLYPYQNESTYSEYFYKVAQTIILELKK